jgi:hypothetical protein
LEKVQVPVGARELTQEYHISQLIKMLENRGVTCVETLNAEDLKEAMDNDVAENECNVRGLIVLSGALPDTVYEGNATDAIFEWISAGGSLYWAGNLLGAYYATADGNVHQVSEAFDYEEAFFGVTGCLNKGDENPELQDLMANDYRFSLSLMNNRIKYGLNGTLFAAGHALAVGYTDGTFASALLVGSGNGMICVIAGDYSSNQRHDLAQIVASGICNVSESVGNVSGEIKRGTVNGTTDVNNGEGFDAGTNYSAYVYYGGYFTVYGRTTGWMQ